MLRGKNPRPAIVLLASSMAVLLVGGIAAAHDLATDPRPTPVNIGGAAADAVPPGTRAADQGHGAGEPEPAAVGLTTHTSPTTGPSWPAVLVPPPLPRADPPNPGPTTMTTAPSSRVAPPPTFVPPLAPPPPPPPSLETVEIGPGAWRSTFEGITATLRMTPVAPRVGQVVHFSIDTTFTGAGCCMVFLYPGDGAMFPPGDNSMDCTQSPSSLHQDRSHTYTRADDFTVHVQPSVLPCRITPDGLALPINSHLYANVSIAPAT